ncbi:MAG: SpoIID/LytB domain-containing protein [Acutalibacteraceae bacterium]
MKVELFAILKEEMSSQTVAQQRMIEGVFASMDGAEVHPFRTFTETKNFFGEMGKAFNRASVIVAAADEKAFLEQKWNLLKALGLKSEICPAVQEVMRESATVPDASMKAHALMPKEAALFLSADGLYSGFAVRSGKQTLLFLPLSESRTQGIMTDGVRRYFEARAKEAAAAQAPEKAQPPVTPPVELPDNNLRFAETALLLADNEMAVAFARTETNVYIQNGMRNNPHCGDSFVPAEAVADSRESVTERMACLAEAARQEIGTALGAAISNIYSLGSNKGMFINVALADRKTAHVRKITGDPEMSAADLVVLATDELFSMVQSYLRGEAFPPEDVELIPAKLFEDTPEIAAENQKKKRGTGLKILLCVLIAIVLCVLIGFYFKDEVSAFFFSEEQSVTEISTEAFTEPQTEYSTEMTTQEEFLTASEEDLALFGMAEAVPEKAAQSVQTLSYETPVDIDWDAAVQPYIEETTKETTTKETTAKATTTQAPATTTTTTKKAEPETTTSTTTEKETTTSVTTTTATTKPVETTTEKATEPAAGSSSADGTFTFTVYGYGHGVGMSQMGALAYAQQGWSYTQILYHYFPGTSLTKETAPATIQYNGKELNTKDFIIRAVQQEIGGYAKTTDTEALKAQAVAAYSYMKAKNYKLTSNDMAYSTVSDSQLSALVKDAVSATLGEYLTYNGKAILAQFYASSAGKTTSAESVWGNSYPYLAGGVESIETVSQTTVTISAADFKEVINKYNAAHSTNPITLSGDPSGWLEILSHDGARGDVGYVTSIRVGDKTMNGNAFRTMFNTYRPSGVSGIRSHCFALAVS